MPELPEVAYLRDELRGWFLSRHLTAMEFVRGRYVKHGLPESAAEFAAALPLRCVDVRRKGKILFLEFEGGWTIVSRLGLTGWWYNATAPPAWYRSPKPNVIFRLSGASAPAAASAPAVAPASAIHYADTLSYGTLTFLKDAAAVAEIEAGLAPDADTISLPVVRARMAARPRMLKMALEDVLIDQSALFSGVGNYLKSEILYAAKLSPVRTLGSLSAAELAALVRSVRGRIRRLSAVVGADVAEYEASMAVYQKKMDPAGRAVATRKTRSGRTTFWVPDVQK